MLIFIMRKTLLMAVLIIAAYSKTSNIKVDTNSTKDANTTKKTLSKKLKLEENIKKAIEKEKQFKNEQKFYQGEDYNLTDKKIDDSSLKDIKAIEPEYDFEMLEF